MGWVARAFGRALIYNTVREGFYEQRHRRASSVRTIETVHDPVERLTAMNKQVLVQFECPDGHRFTLPFTGNHPNERDLSRTVCPTCDEYARWLAMDYHIENDK